MKLTYKCKECGLDILTNNGLVSHIVNYHKIKPEEYYEKYIAQEGEGKCLYCGNKTTFIDLKHGYKKYCSFTCRNKWIGEHDEKMSMKCEECGFTIEGPNKNSFSQKFVYHLKTHGLTQKEYYDKYLKKPDEGKCVVCGKPTSYYNFLQGYAKNCSGICAAQAVKAKEIAEERKFQEEQRIIKQTKEEEYKNYVQELKDRVHQFDWEGERNSWLGGTKPRFINTKDNLITDNSMSYIDGQEYSAEGQCVTEHYKEHSNIVETDEFKDFNDVFWL